MLQWKWTRKREVAALWIAEGYTDQQAADAAEVSRQTIQRWKHELEFAAEVDRLSLMVDIAGRAERLRIAMRAVRQKLKDDGTVRTERDLLDWLKFAQSETDGVKLDLAALAEAASSLAGEGSPGLAEAAEPGDGDEAAEVAG